MEKFEFSLAAQKIHELIWNEYCDWYIELVKSRLYGQDEEEKKVVRYVLIKVLKDLLKLLHPFMPFITEEIWSFLPKEQNAKQFLMQEALPDHLELGYDEDVAILTLSMEAIRAIRNIRAEADAQPSKRLHVVFLTSGKEETRISKGLRYIKNLANIEDIEIINDKNKVPAETMSAALPNLEIFVPLDDLLDYKAEFERLTKEKSRLETEVVRTKGKLSNEGFVEKAPAKVIDAEREKLAKYEDMLEKVLERIPVVEGKIR
jgi:valyl-tRNA synthetase